jgi:glucosyl-3-phosphoglycerate phosphatase
VTGRRLVLLRHGRTAWNDAGRAQGHQDVGLDEVGHAQAADVAPYLASLRPAALWTSDLLRARQTSGYLERATGLAARVDERLREYDVGARQGMTSPEFEAAFPEAYVAWSAGDDLVPVPGSEGAEAVRARMLPALDDALAALSPGETGVVVTHGACLKVAVLGLLAWPARQAAAMRGIDNCAWVTLGETRPAGGLRLEGYNQQTGFVSGGRGADCATAPPVG